MSLVRVNRYGPRGGGRKVLKVRKKKTSLKQEWDNTVNDLTVHRATPEDLIRRHEIHKSKNRALVHWELQEKALRRKWKKQKPEVSNLERRRLSIMKEILSDQYQMQDVLEKSDHLIAEAKDLFVDFPRRRTGFPNVTIAPDSSQGPIVVNQDPVTQAILSESVMEPQALNEVDDDEGGTVNSQSEESENEADNSLNSQSNMNVDRLLHQLKEDNSELINKLWTDIQQKIAAQSQTPSGTPSPAPPSGEQKAALNATGAVKRIHTRVQSEESTAALDSSYVVGQVLNSRKQKQLLNKVKRKPDSHSSSKQKKNTLTASTASTDLPNSNNSSLDVLKHMINEVEHEMEEYERWTGREVRGLQSSQGLTGFTLSLVGSLCRLVRYLKESELQLRKEVETRHQLEQMLGDHRELIDALTAEILFLREENTATQARLQQYMVTTDEQLISLTHAMKNCPVIKSNKESQTSERGSTSRKIIDNLEGPIVNANVSMPLVFRGEEVAEFAQEDLPVKLSQVPAPPDNVTLTNSFPAHVFEPAVLLTPPRQKSSSGFSPLQDDFMYLFMGDTERQRHRQREKQAPCGVPDAGLHPRIPGSRPEPKADAQPLSHPVLRRTVQTRPAPRIPPTVEIIEKEQNWEKNTLPTGTDNQNSNEENHLFTQRWRVSHMGEDVENKAQAPFVNLSQPFCGSHSNTQQARVPEFSEEPPVLGDRQQLKTNEALIQRKDILTRIAELTLQNSAIKAHLNNIIEPGGEQGDGLRELNKQETSHVSNMTTTFPAAQPLIPSSMEERIAELNRQSMEARGKLLQLIEQQKLIGLNLSSPTVSPILSPLRAWTEGGKKTIEVSIPGAEAPESSKCSTISPTSGINTRRSSGATSNSCSPLNATTGSGRFTPVNPRAKIEKQNEEGWFALSTHVS
ncbi:spindle and centriole-associated protein 1 isoform X1 [Canis lupus baileyi]|uniref:spindle and centriole-associated protein 1 isoform X1 n=1 Tax=Canis lupus baileyi TaxID=143281 RepID=UPI003B96E44A